MVDAACPLQYPERFEAAVACVTKMPQGAALPEESKLLLYALQQQATKGPCTEPRPWGWNVVSNAKWQSWKQLGDMPNMEAMRLYVRTLEEEMADWWTPEVATAWEKEVSSISNAQTRDQSSDTTTHSNSLPHPFSPSTTAHQGHAPKPIKSRSVAEVVVEGSWVSPYISSDRRPPPRYEHAVSIIGNLFYVIGGSCGGRYLNDTWALNLENLTWSCVHHGSKSQATVAASKTNKDGKKSAAHDKDSEEPAGEGTALLSNELQQGLPPLAGHTAIPWNGNIISLGGHTREKDHSAPLTTRLFDTKANTWSTLATTPSSAFSAAAADSSTSTAKNRNKNKKMVGPIGVPGARGAHSATLIGSKIYVFGGEDSKRKPSNELWVLDLTTLEWEQHQPQHETSSSTFCAPPSPRSAHTAIAYQNRYIIYFGGGSVATCFNDVYIFDTQTLEWNIPEIDGSIPPPRAGHASSVLGSSMFVVGGGNNARGCADMYSLDLSNIGNASGGALTWVFIGNTPPESAIASEGLSLLPIPMAGCMISFGGYNGKYHSAVHVYRPEGYVLINSAAAAAAAAASRNDSERRHNNAEMNGTMHSTHALPPAAAAAAQTQKYEEQQPEKATPPLPPSMPSQQNSLDIDAARREAAAAKEAVALELSIMRRQLDSATSALSQAEQIAEQARHALLTEQEKSMKLQVEVAELRQKLIAMDDLERELARYRPKTVVEDGNGQGESSGNRGGFWGYITGSDAVNESSQNGE